MKNQKIVVTKVNDIIITLARTVPISTTIIIKEINGTIEPIQLLKQRQYGLLDQTPVVPVNPQPGFNFS